MDSPNLWDILQGNGPVLFQNAKAVKDEKGQGTDLRRLGRCYYETQWGILGCILEQKKDTRKKSGAR